jgi:hypothetical protein
MREQIDSDWDASKRVPSTKNWRFEQQPVICDENRSPEKTLEKAIVELGGKDWANQVPTSSGLTSAKRDKHRNIDLVCQCGPDCYQFIELKYESNRPLYAAMEALVYGVLYAVSRLRLPANFARDRKLLSANTVHLRVLAPQKFYAGYRFDWLESALTSGLEFTRGLGFTMDFRFDVFPADFAWDSSSEECLQESKVKLPEYLKNRGPVTWSNASSARKLVRVS